jgi:hypothetical protein
VGETLLDLMAANGWRGAAAWAGKANDTAPTIAGDQLTRFVPAQGRSATVFCAIVI